MQMKILSSFSFSLIAIVVLIAIQNQVNASVALMNFTDVTNLDARSSLNLTFLSTDIFNSSGRQQFLTATYVNGSNPYAPLPDWLTFQQRVDLLAGNTFSLITPGRRGSVRSTKIFGNRLFVAIPSGFSIWDTTNMESPSNPQVLLVGQYFTPPTSGAYIKTMEVDFAKDLVYLGDPNNGVWIVSISTESEPVLVNLFNATSQKGDLLNILYKDPILYVAYSVKGAEIQFLNYTSNVTAAPGVTTAPPTPPAPAFLSEVEFRIFDMTSSSNPIPRGKFRDPSAIIIKDWILFGSSIIYTAGSFDGLRALSIANLSNPYYLGSIYTGGTPKSLSIEQRGFTSYLHVGHYERRYTIFDVTRIFYGNVSLNSTNTPVFANTTLPWGSSTDSLQIDTNNRLICAASEGVYTLDTSMLYQPQGNIGGYQPPNYETCVNILQIGSSYVVFWIEQSMTILSQGNAVYGVFLGTPGPTGEGNHTVRVASRDTLTNFAAYAYLNIFVPFDLPPVLNGVYPSFAVFCNELTAFPIRAELFQDPNNDTITFRSYGYPSWLYFNSSGYYANPVSGNQGTYRINLTATDEPYNGRTSITFTLTVPNRNPYVDTAISNYNGFVDRDVSISFASNSFLDLDGDSITYSASGMPSWLTFDPVKRTFTGVAEDSGDYNVVVTGSDAYGGSIDSTFQMSIVDPDGNSLTIVVATVVSVVVLLIVIVAIFLIIRRKQEKIRTERKSEIMIVAGSSWTIDPKDLKFQKELGRGSFGVVSEGTWRNTKVAIKKALVSSAAAAESFKKEVDLMQNLRPHKNVILMYGVYQSDEVAIIVMELAQQSLRYYLDANKGKIPTEQIMSIVQGIAAGVGHLHQEGIVHRDLAARNVLLDSTMVPKIGDFGMSRVVDSSDNGSTMNNLGPVAWMSPESLKQNSYSKKSDVWSFGICVWECATQEYPHKGVNLLDLALKIRETGATPPIAENFPSVLKSLCQQCWALDASQRPDMNSIYQTLQNALSDHYVARASINLAPVEQVVNQVQAEGFYQNLNTSRDARQSQAPVQSRHNTGGMEQPLGSDYINLNQNDNNSVTSLKPGEIRNSDYLNV